MKKNLIALAILAAAGAASAQSSVTLYGIADVYFGREKAANGVTNTKIDSGGVSQSRFGFKGTEDLGRGLKANFLLESGFSLDSGSSSGYTQVSGATTATNLFSRQAYVGVSGGFGEVKLGKMWTAYDDIQGATNAVFDSVLSPNVGVWVSGGYNGNPGNSVYYATPAFGPFSGAASYSLGENKTSTTSAGKITSLHAKYEGGPLYAGLAYQTEKANGTALTVKFTRANASYDLGVAKILLGYGRVADAGISGGKTTEYQIGADFPLSDALTLSGGFARSKDNATAGDAKRTGYGIGASYSLSKRTSVYGGFRAGTAKAPAVVDVKTSLLAVGVRHAF
ncbi:MAG: porin [Pseudomonadota bacterium]